MKNCRLWWLGPEWLSQHQEQWLNTSLLRHPEKLPEQREDTTVKVMIQCSPAEFIARLSTLSRLQRVAAYCLRFSHNAKNPSLKRTGYVTSTELRDVYLLYFNSLSVPLKIVPRATLGTRAVGCRRQFYTY